jgi:hypothetical protein
MPTGLLSPLAGLRIVVRPLPRVEVPRHRKKRLAKKWRTRYGPQYRSLPVNEREIWHDPQRGLLYCYPQMQRELVRLLGGEA